MKYCTYLTTYSGNKLPPFYIGSSTVEKVENGYRGSVSSKKYAKTWKSEIKNNPQLFKTKILRKYPTRAEAVEREEVLHKALNVIRSPLYTNMCYAGKIFDSWHQNHSPETRLKMSKAQTERFKSEAGKAAHSKALKGRRKTESEKAAIKKALSKPETRKLLSMKITERNLGSTKSKECKTKISLTLKDKPKVTCPHCNTTGPGSGIMKRWHFDNCKWKK